MLKEDAIFLEVDVKKINIPDSTTESLAAIAFNLEVPV